MTETMIGSYRILRKLSAGGMGTVYEAMHDAIERRVAIKVLHPQQAASSETVRRFFNEAKAANRIDHPGIVQIYDCGQLPGGTAYIVMEFLKGETLGKRLRRFRTRRLLPQNLRLMAQVAEALAAAHAAGIIHRDMKPDNVMVTGDPNSSVGERAKILDFGIAKLRSAGSAGNAVTKDNLLGTPSYMSPEQCKGSSVIDPKTDVYSLGIMLYRLIAARPPFVAEGSGEILAMHMLQAPPPLQKFAPWVDEELAAYVHTLLAKEPADRPAMEDVAQKMSAFSRSLEGFVIPEDKADAAKEDAAPEGPDPGASHSAEDTGSVQPTLTVGAQETPPSWQAVGETPHVSAMLDSPDSEPYRTTQPSMATANGQRQTLTQPVGAPRSLHLVIGGVGAVALGAALTAWLIGRAPPAGTAAPKPATPAAAVATPERIHWSISSVPTGAEVRRAADGALLGHTPWQKEYEPSPQSDELIVVAAGYQPQHLSLHRDRETERAVVLTPSAPAEAADATGHDGKGSAGKRKKSSKGSAQASATEDSASQETRKSKLKATDVLEE